MTTKASTTPKWAIDAARIAYSSSPIKVIGKRDSAALIQHFAKAIHDSLMAERENCALIAESKATDIYRNDDEGVDVYAVGQIIAAAIRGEV